MQFLVARAAGSEYLEQVRLNRRLELPIEAAAHKGIGGNANGLAGKPLDADQSKDRKLALRIHIQQDIQVAAGRKSPRAREPKNAICHTPSASSAGRTELSVELIASVFIAGL